MLWSRFILCSFRLLKGHFTSALILKHHETTLHFMAEVDASEVGMGAVLSQHQGNPHKLYPCAYYSKKLYPAERNYDVGDWELLAVNLALEEWRHWLEGAKDPFLIFTDHPKLEYIRTGPISSPDLTSPNQIAQVQRISQPMPCPVFTIRERILS